MTFNELSCTDQSLSGVNLQNCKSRNLYTIVKYRVKLICIKNNVFSLRETNDIFCNRKISENMFASKVIPSGAFSLRKTWEMHLVFIEQQHKFLEMRPISVITYQLASLGMLHQITLRHSRGCGREQRLECCIKLLCVIREGAVASRGWLGGEQCLFYELWVLVKKSEKTSQTTIYKNYENPSSKNGHFYNDDFNPFIACFYWASKFFVSYWGTKKTTNILLTKRT